MAMGKMGNGHGHGRPSPTQSDKWKANGSASATGMGWPGWAMDGTSLAEQASATPRHPQPTHPRHAVPSDVNASVPAPPDASIQFHALHCYQLDRGVRDAPRNHRRSSHQDRTVARVRRGGRQTLHKTLGVGACRILLKSCCTPAVLSRYLGAPCACGRSNEAETDPWRLRLGRRDPRPAPIGQVRAGRAFSSKTPPAVLPSPPLTCGLPTGCRREIRPLVACTPPFRRASVQTLNF